MANGRPARGSSYGRASLGGLKNLMPGTGIEDGGFEETPSVEVTRPQGPTLTGESMPPEFKFNPGKYKPAKAKSGFADFLTGGESSRAASAQNMQAGLTMQQIAAAQAIQQAQMEAEFARTGMDNASKYRVQELQNTGGMDRTRLEGTNAINTANVGSQNRIAEGNAALMNNRGLTSSAAPDYTARVNPHVLTRAEVESRNAAGFAQTPQGQASQEANYNAILRAPQAKNYSETRTEIPQNSQMFIPSLNGEMGGTMLSGNVRNEQVIQTPETMMLDGKPFQTGTKVNTINTVQPGAAPQTILPPEEKKRREMLRLKAIQDAQGSVSPMPSGEYPVSTPQSFAVPKRKQQAALNPSDLNALVNYLVQSSGQ